MDYISVQIMVQFEVPEDLHFEWQNYTIYGNNSGGSVISKVAIMVNDQLPTIAYEAEQYVLRNDTEMIPIAPLTEEVNMLHSQSTQITLWNDFQFQ